MTEPRDLITGDPITGGAYQHRSAYGQIAAELRAKITAGELAADDWLTTEAELASQHGVSRVTINNAIQMLADDGYVQVIRGRGVRVTAPLRADRAVLEVALAPIEIGPGDQLLLRRPDRTVRRIEFTEENS